ncbi:DUF397 domain-containing protein [Streptomyces vastus]|uniref:DUF397 domain-containing protein n=1 Tax=Streptomyces vastus TaxID=285451 RepID=UPI003CD07BD1
MAWRRGASHAHPGAARWRAHSASCEPNRRPAPRTDGHTTVPVRDSKNPHGPALLFPVGGWSSFVDAVKSGQFPV